MQLWPMNSIDLIKDRAGPATARPIPEPITPLPFYHAYTPPQGRAVLAGFRNFAKRGMAGMRLLADPEKYADLLGRFADLADATGVPANDKEAKLQRLLAGLQAGDKEAAMDFHDAVAEEVWGGGE
jgi:hypothetical protein